MMTFCDGVLCFSWGKRLLFISYVTTLVIYWLLTVAAASASEAPRDAGVPSPPPPVYMCSPRPPASRGRDAKNFVFSETVLDVWRGGRRAS